MGIKQDSIFIYIDLIKNDWSPTACQAPTYVLEEQYWKIQSLGPLEITFFWNNEQAYTTWYHIILYNEGEQSLIPKNILLQDIILSCLF